MKRPNFTRQQSFMEYVDTTQDFPFSFYTLKYGPFGFHTRTFPQHLTNKMKLNEIDEV